MAAPTTPERPGGEIIRDPVAQIDEEAAAYGRWLERATLIEMRVQQQLSGLQPALAEAQAGGGTEQARAGRFRAFVQRALSEIDAADAEIAALEIPRLPTLELPEDVRPAALVRQIRQLNRDIRDLFAGFLPLLDAASPREMESAANRIFASTRLIFESQIVLLRAHQAVTPREDVDWELVSFEIGFLRAGLRIFNAYSPFEPRIDQALPAELIAIADELEANLRNARPKYAAEMVEIDEELAAAERLGDQASVAALRRARNVRRLSQEYFPLAEQLAGYLRAGASLVRGRPLTQDLLVRIFMPMRGIRTGFDEIGLRQARALAE